MPEQLHAGKQRNQQSGARELRDDGTRELLRWGGTILGTGILAILLVLFILGGVGIEGAHSNAGWLALLTGMMCIPFGLLLSTLGVAKWLRLRGLRKRAEDGFQGPSYRGRDRD